MNNQRRKRVASIIEEIVSLSERMEIILNSIEEIKDEEEEYFENIPENLQTSDRYSSAEEAVYNLDTAFEMWQEAFDNIEDIISALQESTKTK